MCGSGSGGGSGEMKIFLWPQIQHPALGGFATSPDFWDVCMYVQVCMCVCMCVCVCLHVKLYDLHNGMYVEFVSSAIKNSQFLLFPIADFYTCFVSSKFMCAFMCELSLTGGMSGEQLGRALCRFLTYN